MEEGEVAWAVMVRVVLAAVDKKDLWGANAETEAMQ
jgi:hypothetical protein